MKRVVTIVAGLLVMATAAPLPAAEPAPPIRALLITGGCCHDYAFQAKQLAAESAKLANIEWTVLHDPRTGTEGEIELYSDPDWAKPYDVVVHNECFANTKDPEYIRKITEAHKAGAPAVVIHCAMHTYRAAEIDDWREFLGVTSSRHEHQANYPVKVTDPEHPTMRGIPADWKTPKDELYVIDKMWPGAKTLATSVSERSKVEHAVFWTNQFGKARVFGTTYGHGNATWEDPVFTAAVTRGILWAADKIDEEGNPKPGYESRVSDSSDWAHQQLVRLPASEKPVSLFNGQDLSGWQGQEGRWSVEEGAIVGRNEDRVPTSTYLFTDGKYRNFRLLLEVKQKRAKGYSTMHSAIAALGEQFDDKGNKYGFKGPLLMCCNDWGIWDAYRRNRTVPAGHKGQFQPEGAEKVGDWNQLEILVIGNRLRMVSNGRLVFDFEDKPENLQASPIGLQLHSNNQPQEYRFRGLVLTEEPEDRLVTAAPEAAE